MMNIYVGNLAYSVTEEDLKDAFGAYGDISRVSLITDKFSGQSKGFGFVEMPNNSEADAAIKGLNETPLKGRNIKVNQAKPRETPSRGGGGGYGGGGSGGGGGGYGGRGRY
jgi:RNA recognition motif-containing protein